jgi:hypothetical protein
MMVLKALALGMPGVPDNFFEAGHSEADNQLRLLHCEFVQVRRLESERDGGERLSGMSEVV